MRYPQPKEQVKLTEANIAMADKGTSTWSSTELLLLFWLPACYWASSIRLEQRQTRPPQSAAIAISGFVSIASLTLLRHLRYA
jgi:hypothetical protein